MAPADAGEGGRGGGGAVRREGRRATPGGHAILRPRQQNPRQGGPGRELTAQSGTLAAPNSRNLGNSFWLLGPQHTFRDSGC